MAVRLLAEDATVVIFSLEIIKGASIFASVATEGIEEDLAAYAAAAREHSGQARMVHPEFIKGGSVYWLFDNGIVEWIDKHENGHVGYRIKVPAARFADILTEMVALLRV